MWKISTEFKLTVDQLIGLNGLTSDKIHVDQKLIISPKTSSKPKPTTTDKKYTEIFQAGKKVKVPVPKVPTFIPQEKPNVKPSNPLPVQSKDIMLASVEQALPLLDTPYSWGGVTTAGFDCSGFIYYVFKTSGLDMTRTDTIGLYDKSFYVDKPMPGDLIFFENTYRSGISHAGIYLGDGNFIHAGSVKVEISSIELSYWKEKIVGFKRFTSLY